jgi:hypothetical protein
MNPNQDDYNHVFNNLQDYMLSEENIKKTLVMKMETNTRTFKSKIEDKIMKPKSSIFVPREKDSLFWCFFIMKYGDAKYEILDNKNIITEKKIKIEYVEKIRKEKQIVKTYKFATLPHLENNLANDNYLDIKTFLTLCAIENLNILFVKNKTYYELLMNDSNELHIVYLLQNDKYGYEMNATNSEQIKSTYYKLDNIDKPIKSMTGYKISELIEICQKLAIDTINKETNKSKCKKDLYESIIQYF